MATATQNSSIWYEKCSQIIMVTATTSEHSESTNHLRTSAMRWWMSMSVDAIACITSTCGLGLSTLSVMNCTRLLDVYRTHMEEARHSADDPM
jgi:hypothetical protein